MYSERLLELFRSREHGGALERATHFGQAGTPGGGPWVQIWLRVQDGIVLEARWRSYGCPAAIACSEAACRWAEARQLAQVAGITPELLTAEVDDVPEGKEHCPRLVAEAVAAAPRMPYSSSSATAA